MRRRRRRPGGRCARDDRRRGRSARSRRRRSTRRSTRRGCPRARPRSLGVGAVSATLASSSPEQAATRTRITARAGRSTAGSWQYRDRVTNIRLDDVLDDLRALVEVESPSHDLDAVSKSAAAVAALIERRLGAPVRARRQPGRTARALARARRAARPARRPPRHGAPDRLARRPPVPGRRRPSDGSRCVRHEGRDRARRPRRRRRSPTGRESSCCSPPTRRSAPVRRGR